MSEADELLCQLADMDPESRLESQRRPESEALPARVRVTGERSRAEKLREQAKGARPSMSVTLRGLRAFYGDSEQVKGVDLEFCANENYHEPKWPDDYWPGSPAPADDAAWTSAIDEIHRETAAFATFTADERHDLTAKIPHGTGQTYLRTILVAIDHIYLAEDFAQPGIKHGVILFAKAGQHEIHARPERAAQVIDAYRAPV